MFWRRESCRSLQPPGIFFFAAPFGLRIAVEGPQAGAGGIHQYPVESGSRVKEKRAAGIHRQPFDDRQSQTFGILFDQANFLFMKIESDNLPAILHELGDMGRFPARGRAGVQDPFPRAGVEGHRRRSGRPHPEERTAPFEITLLPRRRGSFRQSGRRVRKGSGG